MRVFFAVIGMLALTALPLSCGPNASSSNPVGPALLRGVTVAGPSSLAPGAAAQYSATATYSDGSSRDVTADAQWYSSNTSVVSITATAFATAVAIGDASVTATYGGVVRGVRSIVVAPAGTFRISGLVTGLGWALDGALVQVNAGTGAGLSSLTVGGVFRIYGVAGDIQLAVSMAGYVTAVQPVTVNSNADTNLDFVLMPVSAPPDVTGIYALRISADSACPANGSGALSDIARARHYGASVAAGSGYQITATLTGASFTKSNGVMHGSVTENGARFWVNDPGYYYSGFRDVAELLPDGNVYLFSGDIEAVVSGPDLVGTLNGTIRVNQGSVDGPTVGLCTSAHHQVAFLRESITPKQGRGR